MTIKQNQLKEIIKQVVRESLNEKNQLPSEKIPPGKLTKLNPNFVKPAGKGKFKLPPKKVNEMGLTSENKNLSVIHALNNILRNIEGDLGRLSHSQLLDLLERIRQILSAIVKHLESANVNEASYKVVAPRSATDAKEDKARRIQTEPKVNETAYKTQGPIYKTFEDSPKGDAAYELPTV